MQIDPVTPIDGALWLLVRSAITQAEVVTGYGKLDRLSQSLLEWITERVGAGRGVLYVSEIVRHSEIASPATLSKLLARLEELGLISITEDPDDHRCRRIDVTEEARLLFDRLSDALRGRLELIIRPAK